MARLQSQLAKVRGDDEAIHGVDREPIQSFLEAERGRKADSTVAQYAVNLRTLSRRSERPLIDSSPQDMQSLLDELANGNHPDVKDSGIQVQTHASTLSRFGDHHDIPFEYSEFDFEPSRGRDLSPDDLLTQEDVDAILKACGMDIRYKALIAWGLASGLRLDALRTVRMKHVEWEGSVGEITLNVEEGALKGASGRVPMFWAKHYIRDWLDVHPFPDDPEAGLFIPDPRINGNQDSLVSKEPLAQSTIRHKLNSLQDRADLEKNLYPHLLRHCAFTRMALEGVPEQDIKSLAAWHGDSSEIDTYVTLADELRNDNLRESMGLPTSGRDHAMIGKPTLVKCPECGEEYPPKMEACPTCSIETVSGGMIDLQDLNPEQAKHLIDQIMEDFLHGEGTATGSDPDTLIGQTAKSMASEDRDSLDISDFVD